MRMKLGGALKVNGLIAFNPAQRIKIFGLFS